MVSGMSGVSRRGLIGVALLSLGTGRALAETGSHWERELPTFAPRGGRAAGAEAGGAEPGANRLFTPPGGGPGRRNHDERRLEFERRAAQERGALVFAGDSITQLFGSLQGQFPRLRVANRGINGDTAAGLRGRFGSDVLALNPRGIVLLIGSNDLAMGASPEQVAGHIHALVQAARAVNPAPALVLCTIMPRAPATPEFVARIRRTNQFIISIAQSYRGVTLCDSWRALADASGAPRAADFPDGVHPSAAGYSKWMGALRPALRRLKLA